MNIFVLDESPVMSAQMLCDKHCSKMIVESGQMLSTAHRMLDGKMVRRPSKSGKTMVKHWILDDDRDELLYKAVHMGHPCTVWSMVSEENYRWHYEHFVAMGEEFAMRRGKQHLTYTLLKEALAASPRNIPKTGLTEFAVAMKQFPDCVVPGNPVKSYRNYYVNAKSFAKWDWGRPAPEWFTEMKKMREQSL